MRNFMCRPIICFTADIITKAQDPACTDCVNNEGLCYDSTLDKKYDGCVCPASRSGQNCSDIHGKTHIKNQALHDFTMQKHNPSFLQRC